MWAFVARRERRRMKGYVEPMKFEVKDGDWHGVATQTLRAGVSGGIEGFEVVIFYKSAIACRQQFSTQYILKQALELAIKRFIEERKV
jgi:hypothetical protein